MKFNNDSAVTRCAGVVAIALMASASARVMAEDGWRTKDDDKRAPSEVVTIRNTSAKPLTLGAPLYPEGFEHGKPLEKECRSKLGVGEECRISVRFVPTHVGEYSGELKIPVNDAEHPHLIVKLTGRGVPRSALTANAGHEAAGHEAPGHEARETGGER